MSGTAESPSERLSGSDPLALAAYNQNFETFRALNALMWQIPLIGMTLTGGLWFGVSKVDSRVFRAGLLMLAAFGDVGLIIILQRLRHIMAGYLDWLKAAFPNGHVAAPKKGVFTGERTVKLVFQALLGSAALISVVLLAVTMLTETTRAEPQAGNRATAWYDTHAERLAGEYEGLAFDDAHPELLAWISQQPVISILDVGCGTGRDAAALAALGHDVTAVDPSPAMLAVARRLHRNARVRWSADALPQLGQTHGRFDLILLSAVWMHVASEDRPAAMRRLTGLMTTSGRMHVTLRLGDAEAERGVHPVSVAELERLAGREGLDLTDVGERADLLGRINVAWRTVVLRKT